MCLHLGALEDCLMWASGGHVTFWAFVGGLVCHDFRGNKSYSFCSFLATLRAFCLSIY